MTFKIWVLLWKDLLIRKNHFIVTSAEVLLPIGLIVLLNLSLPYQENEAQDDTFSFESFRETKCVSRHSTYGKIIYEPSTPFTDDVMAKAACYAGYKKSNVKPGNLQDNSSLFSIGVKFENAFVDRGQSTLNYTLFPVNRAWDRMSHLWRYGHSMPRYSTPTVLNVVELQRAIDATYLELKNISSKQITFKNMDLFGRNPNIFLGIVNLSLFLVFSLMHSSALGRTVREKRSGAKELMLTTGVTRWQLWVAKFLDALFFSTITVSGMVLFLYVPLKEESNYLEIPPLALWSVLFYGLIAVVIFLFFISCIFEKPTVAVFTTEIIWALLFLIKNVISYSTELPAYFNYLLCLVPHFSVMESVTMLLTADAYGKEIKLLENLTPMDDSLCLFHTLLMTTVVILLCPVLIWYLEQVNPGKYGIPQPLDFCFKNYYWFQRQPPPSSPRPEELNESFELVGADLKPGVSVKGVSKRYASSDKTWISALNNINLNFYLGEISGVLGHNGAGKSTLLSTVTGMTKPSQGTVIVNGFDLNINLYQARRSIGLCPQQDMLFNDLTVMETLKFYGVVKGLSLEGAKNEALDLIEKLKLTNVTHTQASNLSGGQKRKVSLGIALIGGSDVLVLDEPTSGMDTEIRREIWEILLTLRKSRTIILSTHFMEEADALCDRIAILRHGDVQCHGTPMYLKTQFGTGYTLKIVVTTEDKIRNLKESLKEVIPLNDHEFQCQGVRTLTVQLHQNFVYLHGQKLFEVLENKRRESEIKSFCLNLTTLEDVFLRLRRTDEELIVVDTVDSPRYKKLENTESSRLLGVPRCFLLSRQFGALMQKKLIFLRRSYKTFLMLCVMPFLIITLMTVISKRSTGQNNQLGHLRRLPYSLDLYPSSLVFYSNLQDPQKVELFENLVRTSGSKFKEVGDIMEGVRKIFEDDFYTYAKKINFGVDFSSDNLVIYHNDYGIHMVPVALNFIHNFLLKAKHNYSSIVTAVDGRFANKELLFLSERNQEIEKCSIVDLSVLSGTQSMFYLMGPLKESLHGAKEIQLMSTPAFLYWLSHLFFDSLTFMPYITTLYFGLGFYLKDSFMIENAGEILTGLFLWGSGLILFSYVISTLKKDVVGALSLNIFFYFVFSFIVNNLVSLHWVPTFLQYLHPSSILMSDFSDFCSGARSYFIPHLLFYDFALFAYLLAVDSGVPSAVFHFLVNTVFKVDYGEETKEDDVEEEKENVKKMVSEHKLSNIPLVASDLRRWYFRGLRPFPAVRGVSFSVNKRECFGLLGVNGAGKTSTFRMLGGMLPPSRGNIYNCSKELSLTSRGQYLFSVGYCPQSGGIIPSFTGRELLTLFARLRGLKESQVEDDVEDWLEKLNLLEYAKEQCGTYSGGNKRKLSTAIALIGNCPLVFLDEPTSGVDPVSRRSIWKAIRHVQNEGRSVILTSHSMDECEALCSSLAIMVRGRFRCIGETPTLKERFRLGYCLQLKLTTEVSRPDVEHVKDILEKILGAGCKLVDEHLTMLQYHLTGERISFSGLFERLELLKLRKIVESYTVSSTSLEQIFIHLARSCLES